jgi:hypothetical protein
MEATQLEQTVDANALYAHAANMMVNEKRTRTEVVNDLVSKGLDQHSASLVVSRLIREIADAKQEAARKDMLYGALWCVGGTVLTVANVGYIFWGAIIFGGIQFFKGLINSMD